MCARDDEFISRLLCRRYDYDGNDGSRTAGNSYGDDNDSGRSGQNVVDWLDPAAGEWYSTKGNLVMTIEGNTINGCTVTDPKDCTYDYPRTGTFTIHEQTGDRTIKMDLMGHKSHQYLIVDNKMPLRRSLNADRYESIGGVYLA